MQIVKPTNLPPKHATEFLARLCGKSPFGDPIYTVALAQDIFMVEGGSFSDWDESLSVTERGGMVTKLNQYGEPVQLPSNNTPIRTTVGYREIRKYPQHQGWIVQRWYPAHVVGGSRAEWEAQRKFGLQLLGPYPETGDYEMVAGPAPELPSQSELQYVVETIECRLQMHRKSLKQRQLERYNQALEAEEKRQDAARRDTFLKLRDQFSYLRGSSLEAGRLREDLAQRVRAKGGQMGHVGN